MTTASASAPQSDSAGTLIARLVGRFGRELVAVALLLFAFLLSARLSRYFLDARYLLDSTSLFAESGVMALSMTFIIIAGKIDLSVASALALVASVTAVLHERYNLQMGAACAAGLSLGALLGLANGLMIVRLRLPSLTVTLGTLALYRGIAQILIGDHSLSRFPAWFVGIDYVHVGPLPAPLLVVLVLAALAAILLHYTIVGRWCYAVGANQVASRYSGLPVGRAVIGLFTASGLLSGIAGLMMMSRLQVARYDMASGLELDVITAVVLGGTDIFGGRGTIFGTVVALFLIGVLRTGMGLANVRAETQLIVVGALLILSIGVPNLVKRLRREEATI